MVSLWILYYNTTYEFLYRFFFIPSFLYVRWGDSIPNFFFLLRFLSRLHVYLSLDFIYFFKKIRILENRNWWMRFLFRIFFISVPTGLPYSQDEGCPMVGTPFQCHEWQNIWPGVPLYENDTIIQQPVNLKTLMPRYVFASFSLSLFLFSGSCSFSLDCLPTSLSGIIFYSLHLHGKGLRYVHQSSRFHSWFAWNIFCQVISSYQIFENDILYVFFLCRYNERALNFLEAYQNDSFFLYMAYDEVGTSWEFLPLFFLVGLKILLYEFPPRSFHISWGISWFEIDVLIYRFICLCLLLMNLLTRVDEVFLVMQWPKWMLRKYFLAYFFLSRFSLFCGIESAKEEIQPSRILLTGRWFFPYYSFNRIPFLFFFLHLLKASGWFSIRFMSSVLQKTPWYSLHQIMDHGLHKMRTPGQLACYPGGKGRLGKEVISLSLSFFLGVYVYVCTNACDIF